ncbi:hypothetical protein MLD38_036274 [Melastoma candidum]|uniref:Uncharacterized protein n=1 Tax=Melastoma candidum TaxID=119954 RepID=A0ACB9LJ26_9MYRT|nr:hypothetical protein MLD38_036274 [Melastoma candidum]
MSYSRAIPCLRRVFADEVSNGPARATKGYKFATASTLSKSPKEKESRETSQKKQEAAEAVKDTAEEVKKTARVITDATKSTADTISKMTNVVSEKVTECTDAVKGKAKDTLISGASNAAKATMEIIKDKVVGK